MHRCRAPLFISPPPHPQSSPLPLLLLLAGAPCSCCPCWPLLLRGSGIGSRRWLLGRGVERWPWATPHPQPRPLAATLFNRDLESTLSSVSSCGGSTDAASSGDTAWCLLLLRLLLCMLLRRRQPGCCVILARARQCQVQQPHQLLERQLGVCCLQIMNRGPSDSNLCSAG